MTRIEGKFLIRLSYLGGLAAAVLTLSSAEAAPVGSNDVVRAIGNWRHRRGTLGAKLGEKVRDVRRIERNGVAFHVVRFEGGGHLIASADTKIRPVVMFSEGDDLDLDENNPAIALIVADIEGELGRTRAGGSPGNSILAFAALKPSRNENEWAELLDDDIAFASRDTLDDVRVAPILTTKWNQSAVKGGSAYCYNYYTPNHYPCGCVATALAQVMKHFAWPQGNVKRWTSEWTQIDGVSTNMTTQGGAFDWANMPDAPGVSATESERQAIGKLTSDAGILVGMHYASGGSGSLTQIGWYALTQTVLGYSSAMLEGAARDGTDVDYRRVMISNFNSRRPVLLGVPGHAIVGDGYGYNNGTLHYHLNMGWSGSSDYWYSVPVSDEDPLGGGYNRFNGIVYNIYTTEDPGLVILSGRATDKESGEAVEGLSVSAFAAGGEAPVAEAETDEHGIYSMLVEPGVYTVVARKGSADHRFEYVGTATGEALRCVTQETRGWGELCEPYGPRELGNCSDCDFTIEAIKYEPEAVMSVGEVSVLTNFAIAKIPVTAKVVHYGQTATRARVVVQLSIAGGEVISTKDFMIEGDFGEHTFDAAFDGLTAGEKYTVTAQVVMNTGEPACQGESGFVAARGFTWFEESATSFTKAKWIGSGVRIKDGGLSIDCAPGDGTTFESGRPDASCASIVFKIRECGSYVQEALRNPDGVAAVAAIVKTPNLSELVLWGNGKWNLTGFLFEEKNGGNFDVKVDFDFLRRRVMYSVGETVLGMYMLDGEVSSVSTISFDGYSILERLSGTAMDSNLVKDANGTEYSNYETAKGAGATGALSPLWLSTWNLADGSGTIDVRDTGGLVTFTGSSKVLKSETQPDGSERKWYAVATDDDIAAGAEKYVKTTVDLGLAKAITDDTVVKIGNYLVANGEMSFVVEVGDETVARETVKNLVEVRATLEDDWVKPADSDIRFEDGKVIVTPNRGGVSGFAHVRISAD